MRELKSIHKMGIRLLKMIHREDSSVIPLHLLDVCLSLAQIYAGLFLTAGLVPWFYFNEALNNGTNALREYDYLVKKVVFKISILPIIKVIAATFIHVFFVAVLLIVAALYGYYPTVYTTQILYYSACLFVFVLALCYATCAVVVFFKDLTQIIGIALQIGIWATPILWNIDSAPGEWVVVLKLNPLVYIVNGYRSAIYERSWFFEDFFSTMYFWIVTVVLFGIGVAAEAAFRGCAVGGRRTDRATGVTWEIKRARYRCGR